jgi:hypothetical protein
MLAKICHPRRIDDLGRVVQRRRESPRARSFNGNHTIHFHGGVDTAKFFVFDLVHRSQIISVSIEFIRML